jgi:hypothetical protein
MSIFNTYCTSVTLIGKIKTNEIGRKYSTNERKMQKHFFWILIGKTIGRPTILNLFGGLFNKAVCRVKR